MFNFNGCMCTRLSLTPFIFRISSFQKLCEKNERKENVTYRIFQSPIRYEMKQRPEFPHISRRNYRKIAEFPLYLFALPIFHFISFFDSFECYAKRCTCGICTLNTIINKLDQKDDFVIACVNILIN